MDKQLETPQELADRLHLPVSTIRKLIKQGSLEHIFLSRSKRNPKIPVGAWENFLATNSVKPNLPQAQFAAEYQVGGAK